MKASANLLLIVLGLLLAGCAVGPNYSPPRSALPGGFAHSAPVMAPATNASPRLAEWWTVLNDEMLTALIREGAASNLDVRIATSRVGEAKALRGITRSGFYPQIGAGGDYARSRLSENGLVGRQLTASGQSLENDFFALGMDMSWEIDVFGGTRRAVEAAQADLEAGVESSRAVLVAVLAEVGLSYLDLRGAQKQLAVTRENLRLQEQTLALTRDRFQAGLASELDTARAEAQATSTRAQIPPLERAEQQAIHRLGVLLGRQPTELEARLALSAPIPAVPPRVPVGLPSELLRQRPDIRRSERQLAAATARIGLATADLFPKFYLTAIGGLQSIEASDFFDGGSRFWSLGPSVRWPIFTAGRIRQNIKVQDARQEQALLAYEQSILTALEEVENGLVAFGKEQERYQSLVESETANRRAVQLADARYRGGLVDFLNVLEAQRSLLAVQDELARSERTLGQSLVRLYKALGGGWKLEAETATTASPQQARSSGLKGQPIVAEGNALGRRL